MKPYLLYIFIGVVFLTLIRTSFKIDRSERNQRLSDELCKIDQVYCK